MMPFREHANQPCFLASLSAFLSLVAVIRGMIFVAPTSAEHLLRQQKSLFIEVQVRQTMLPVLAVLIL